MILVRFVLQSYRVVMEKNNNICTIILDFRLAVIMSDDSDGDFFRQSKRKRRVGCLLDDEDEDADSSVELTKKIKGSKRNCIRDSDSDSESSVEVFQRRKRIAVSGGPVRFPFYPRKLIK